ncbi:MAG: hypothetical protein KDI06_09190 [Calditrichaeota bacterium]|nr:hypothetical protein [Calditrichota bacterium]
MRSGIILSFLFFLAVACTPPKMPIPTPEEALVARGRDLFLNETFAGNGRTCGTCHPPENNFTLDAAFIAGLPPNDPLFVAENNPDLANNFENPTLMRQFSMIVENLDGFDSLATKFTMRGIPHVLGMRHSIASQDGPRTGWSGDGAPGDGSLKSFATGAVIQHFTKTLNRVPGRDFRLPTEDELVALEAFQLSLGRQEELTLPLPLKSVVALRGQELFNSPAEGKCFACHFNAGANVAPALFGPDALNLNFNTGVEDLPDQPGDLTGERIPFDDGFGIPGDTTFNIPSLIESADTGPFFHNNAVETIEGAVAFYDGDAFNESPAAQLIIAATGTGIEIDGTQIVAIAAFLRVINTLENIRETTELLTLLVENRFLGGRTPVEILKRAARETEDAIDVLRGGALHPLAVKDLRKAYGLIQNAIKDNYRNQRTLSEAAIKRLRKARSFIIE